MSQPASQAAGATQNSQADSALEVILLPVDFSDLSRVALEYAHYLSDAFGAEIILLHAYYFPPVGESQELQAFSQKLREEKLQLAETHAQQLIRGLELEQGIKLTPKILVREGYPDDVIVEVAIEEKADLIVMATMGAGSLAEKIVGSTTATVIKSAPCPVLAVPLNARYRPFTNLVFATNYDPEEIEVLRHYLWIASRQGIPVHCVHIHRKNEEHPVFRDSWIAEAVELADGVARLDFTEVANEDIIEGLQAFAQGKNADLIALKMHRRFVVDQLYSESLTRALTMSADFPLMTYPIWDVD